MTMKTTVPLILASGSPRRQQLLRDLGLEFNVVVREVDESFLPGLSPESLAEYLACLKNDACHDLIPNNLVITSDTIVALEGRMLGKPRTREEAFGMLESLSGKVNQVISGVCIRHGSWQKVFHAVTDVYFRDLVRWEIQYYVDQYRPYDKAGAYGIQEWIGMAGIDRIEGDYYNVVGMPVGLVWNALKPYLAEGDAV